MIPPVLKPLPGPGRADNLAARLQEPQCRTARPRGLAPARPRTLLVAARTWGLVRNFLLLALLAFAGITLATPARSQSQTFEHRWAGLIFDAFQSADGARVWTVEDGGRIRHRNAAGNWSYQTVPAEVKDTLQRVHFLADNQTGWAVGHNGWVLKTVNGGTSWTALFQKDALTSGKEELFDVHFLDALNGWLVGLHGVWYTTTGGLTEASWLPAGLSDAVGAALDPEHLELYAIDLVQRDGFVLGLVVTEPGYILRSVNPQATSFQVVWSAYSLCGSGLILGCLDSLCNPTPTKYEPWDVEISRNTSPAMKLALVAGGIGVGCGLVVSSTDDGLTWTKDVHEGEVPGPTPCSMDPLYSDDPDTLTDTWRHCSFKTLYGVAILDGDNTGVAAGYNGQHVFRVGSSGVWQDRSEFSDRPVEATTATVFPLYGAVADMGTVTSGTALLTGPGGHVRRTVGNVETWTNDLDGDPWRTTDVHFVDASNGWQVGQFFRIAKSPDGGTTWDMQDPPAVIGTTGLAAIEFAADGLTGVTVGVYDSRLSSAFQNKPKILRTADAGLTAWSEPSTIINILGTNADFKALWDVDCVTGSEFWAAGNGGLIYHTTDGGQSWVQHADLTNGIATFQKYVFEGVSFLNSSHGVFVGWLQTSSRGQALAYSKVGSVETWTDIKPANPDIERLSDVQILGTSAYAVGQIKATGGAPRKGVILRSDFAGGTFGQFAPISHPEMPACTIGGDLDRPEILVLNQIAVNSSNGDIWVGGECGRVWRFTTGLGWSQLKSQTDAHINGMSLTPSGHLYVNGTRLSNTQQCLTRWRP